MATKRSPEWFRDLENDLDSAPTEISSRNSSARSRCSGRSRTTLDSNSTFIQEDVDFDDDSYTINGRRSRENSAKYGRRSSVTSSNSRPESGLTFTTTATTATSLDYNFLEESLSNLNIFNRLQREQIQQSDFNSENLYYKNNGGSTSPVQNLVIPELPEGQHLVINIRSTWGDRHYVGLNGIEMYSSEGLPITIKSIWADPPDINVLPEYSKDPRVVTNLINGIYRTTDDLNLWLAPFTLGNDHVISITFECRVRLAMLRIWNYNKSRIHSFRGARDIEVSLDDQLIFRGEIAKASGGLTGPLMDAFGDMILFTLDEDILQSISQNDDTFSAKYDDMFSQYSDDTDKEMNRPLTANSNRIDDELQRPLTVAEYKAESRTTMNDRNHFQAEGKLLQIILHQNWSGDSSLIGLTSLEIFSDDEMASIIVPDVVETHPVPFPEVTRLFDGENVTTDSNRMFLFQQDYNHNSTDLPSIVINFHRKRHFNGIRVWNYNSSLEESYLGVKLLSVRVDGRLISPPGGFLIRRAPGNRHYDFAQEINLLYPHLTVSSSHQSRSSHSIRLTEIDSLSSPEIPLSRMSAFDEYEPTVTPRGFVFQFQLFSTWNDSYYVGLNGIELYDGHGQIIPLTGGDIAAFPDSVNVLDGINDDVRTPDKLIDGINDSRDARHMWLAPILPKITNRVYVIFDYPVTVSIIKLWNYAHKPGRGVKEFALLVDDLLVYHGTLKIANSNDGYPVAHSTILFTKDDYVYKQERPFAIRSSPEDSRHTSDQNDQFKRDQTDQCTVIAFLPINQIRV
ncbi:hypothetical protein CHUAL_004038 [Chamberlinius hualienensis]